MEVDPDGIIRRIEHTRAKDCRDEEYARLDGTDLFATAGFVDCHTHAIFGGSRSSEHFERWSGNAVYGDSVDGSRGIRKTIRHTNQCSDSQLVAVLRKRLERMLRAGTTTVEIKCGYGGTIEEELRLLRMISDVTQVDSIPAVSATFLPLHSVPKHYTIEEHLRQALDAIPTVAADGLARQVDMFPEQGFFGHEECLRLMQAASEHGLSVRVHADQLTPMATCEKLIPHGCNSVDHLEHISESGIRALAASNTVAVFLPTAMYYLRQQPPPAREIINSGARFAIASDFNPGTAPIPLLQFALLEAARTMGLEAWELLCASTWGGACALDLEADCGTLQVGNTVALSLWPGNGTAAGKHGIELLQDLFASITEPAAVIAGESGDKHRWRLTSSLELQDDLRLR
jgi:imidazolonepropionase